MISHDDVLFNELKHHLSYIKSFIKNIQTDDLKTKLSVIGASQLDVYFGYLIKEQIAQEVVENLKIIKIYQRDQFIKWINSVGYKKIKLSDSSDWIVRFTPDKNQYVHIHPGRYSLYTFRVKANILKTAIGYLILKNTPIMPISLEFINTMRVENLNLSPLKNIHKSAQLQKIIQLLTRENACVR